MPSTPPKVLDSDNNLSSNNMANNQSDDEEEHDADGGIRIGDIYIPPPPPPACTFDPTGPRLVISNIIIENFKSYGGKVALGPFQKNFTAIIGPNGSGKSNVIDSMLFVFGYRAQKIRSKTVGVLIHNSEKHPGVTSCVVTVYFQKIIDKSADECEVVPGSQFEVSRTAFKDNSSFYSINGRRTQFKEVTRLLRSYGIDLDHNRFLILQGEVEQISLMKPKSQNEHETGMLEFLEDIIGSGRFKDPIEKLSGKVETLNELRTEKLNRVKAVEKEKDELAGPKDEAMEYIVLKNELTMKTNFSTQCYIYSVKKQMDDNLKLQQKLNGEIEAFMEKYKDINEFLSENRKKCNEIDRKLKALTDARETLQEKFRQISLEDVRCREDIKHTSGKIKGLKQSIAKDMKALKELQITPEKLGAEISELETRKAELEEEKKKVEANQKKVMAALHSETKSLQDEKDARETELIQLQKDVDETKSRMNVAQVKLDLYLKGEQDEKNRLAELQRSYENCVETLENRQREIKSLQAEIPKLESTFMTEKDTLAKMSVKESEITEELRVQRMKYEEAKSAANSNRNRGRLLEALMKEKNSGRIPGIIGRLGDLGAIDQKYDVAVSTACRQLDNIVTDTLTTAQTCVKFLKQHNLGQATFIGLDKMQTWKEHTKRKISTPQNVPRLFDLIKVKDESILPAFYFALRDTLVANDINQATVIGLQGHTRYRVVTLKGEMIELSGTMSGGGSHYMTGRMGSSVVENTLSPEQIKAMEGRVEALQQQMTDVRRQLAELQEQTAAHERQLADMKHTLQKYNMEVETLAGQRPLLDDQIKEQKKQLKAAEPDKHQVKLLTQALGEEKAAYQRADEAASETKALVQNLHEQILKIGGDMMKSAQKLVDAVNKKMNDVIGAMNKNRVTIKAAERNGAKLEEKLKMCENDLKESDAKLQQQKKSTEDAEVLGAEVLEQLQENNKGIERTEEELKEVKGEAKNKEHAKSKLDMEKLQMDDNLGTVQSNLRENKNRMNEWVKKRSKLKLEEVDSAEQAQLPTYPEEELTDEKCRSVSYEMALLEDRLKMMKPNLAVINEYKQKEQLYLERVEELDRITKDRDTQRQHHDNLRKQRLNEFMEGFQIITLKLKETYQMLTLGGDAELELVNSLDPFSDGIVFSVRPPRKSWKNISNLSGGEKTLSSLALVFALHYYKPTPFYVMDEIDAALDFRNVTIVGHYIKEQTKNAQFIVISLRNNMFELADRLVGVFKTYHSSHATVVDLRKTRKQQEQKSNQQQARDRPPDMQTQQPQTSEGMTQ